MEKGLSTNNSEKNCGAGNSKVWNVEASEEIGWKQRIMEDIFDYPLLQLGVKEIDDNFNSQGNHSFS